jgi:hypothetical protein
MMIRVAMMGFLVWIGVSGSGNGRGRRRDDGSYRKVHD